jgi:peptide/nickel transport system ATP-binding protein
VVAIEDLNIQFTGGETGAGRQRREPVRAPGRSRGADRRIGLRQERDLRTLLRLHPERKTTMKGKVQVAGHDVLALKGKALNACAARPAP